MNTKRIISLITVLLIIISAFPITVLAADSAAVGFHYPENVFENYDGFRLVSSETGANITTAVADVQEYAESTGFYKSIKFKKIVSTALKGKVKVPYDVIYDGKIEKVLYYNYVEYYTTVYDENYTIPIDYDDAILQNYSGNVLPDKLDVSISNQEGFDVNALYQENIIVKKGKRFLGPKPESSTIIGCNMYDDNTRNYVYLDFPVAPEYNITAGKLVMDFVDGCTVTLNGNGGKLNGKFSEYIIQTKCDYNCESEICAHQLNSFNDVFGSNGFEKENMIFAGWYTDLSYQTKIDDLKDVGLNCSNGTFNKTIYAKWTCVAHTWDSGHIVKNPTCCDRGELEKKCTVCGACESEVIYCIPHNYVKTIVDDEKGGGSKLYKYTCSMCGDYYYDYIPTNEHSYVAKEIIEPTCIEIGSIVYECEICGDTYTSYTPALGHNFGYNNEYENCILCGAVNSHTPEPTVTPEPTSSTEPTKPSEHTHIYENYVSDNNATCTKDGTKTAFCSICGEKDVIVDVGSAKGHTYTTKVVKPTCTAKGYTLHTCSACKTNYKDAYKNALGHYCKWITTTKATYFSYGKKQYKCLRCGKVYKTASISKLTLKKPSIKLTSGRKKITVKFDKINGAKKYEISIKIGNKWYKYYTTKTSYTKQGLKKGTKYYVKVRALTTSGSKKAYSSYSSTKYIRAK